MDNAFNFLISFLNLHLINEYLALKRMRGHTHLHTFTHFLALAFSLSVSPTPLHIIDFWYNLYNTYCFICWHSETAAVDEEVS